MICPASGKRTWRRRSSAHREAKRLTRMNRESRARSERAGAEVREYQCPDCGGWHVMSDKDSARPRHLREEGRAA